MDRIELKQLNLNLHAQNTDNQMTSLVFKFNDGPRLANLPDWRTYLNWPDWFREHAHTFYTLNSFDGEQHEPLVDILTPQFSSFIDVLKRYKLIDQPELDRPSFLYTYVEPTAFVTLSKQAIQAPRQYRQNYNSIHQMPHFAGPLPFRMPNLFNYFKVELSPVLGGDEKAIQALLQDIELYLPHKKAFEAPLLHYAYLKDDPQAPTATTPAALGASQFYFNDMDIATTLAPPAQPIGLTVLEPDSWYLSHPQFTAHLDRLYPPPAVFDMAKLDTFQAVLSHGTWMLGILIAKGGDKDLNGNDLCQGIAPNLSVRLVSCLTKGTEIVGGHLHDVRYNEAAAMLTAISVTQLGETILAEVTTGGQRFPIDVQPAIYELLRIAEHIGITMVAAAGNDSCVLNTVKEGGDEPLLPRDLRSVISRRELEHSHTHWNVYTNAANQHRMTELANRYNATLDPPFKSVDDFLDHYQETPSPAILVGAAFRNDPTSNDPVHFDLIPESSRGNRVKVFAQGSNTLTTATKDKLFATIIGNTSGASAIVAGVVGLAQQQAHVQGKPIIPPDSMRTWLSCQTNQPVVASTEAGIVYTGIVPSCKKLFVQAGLAT
jgi:Subtilase family